MATSVRLLLDYAAFALVLLAYAPGVILSLVRPRQEVLGRAARWKAGSPERFLRRSAAFMGLLAAALVVATLHATMPVLWGSLAVGVCFLLASSVFVVVFTRKNGWPPQPELPEPTEADLARATRKERRDALLWIPPLLLWILAWRRIWLVFF